MNEFSHIFGGGCPMTDVAFSVVINKSLTGFVFYFQKSRLLLLNDLIISQKLKFSVCLISGSKLNATGQVLAAFFNFWIIAASLLGLSQ